MRKANIHRSRHVLRKFQAALGPRFTLQQAIEHVQKKRKRKIIFVYKRVHMAYPGLCASLKDVDIIFLIPGIERMGMHFYLITILHELVHIYLGHAEILDMDFNEFKNIEEFIPTIHKDITSTYTSTKEDIAETTATFLTDCIEKHKQSIPKPAVKLYGY